MEHYANTINARVLREFLFIYGMFYIDVSSLKITIHSYITYI